MRLDLSPDFFMTFEVVGLYGLSAVGVLVGLWFIWFAFSERALVVVGQTPAETLSPEAQQTLNTEAFAARRPMRYGAPSSSATPQHGLTPLASEASAKAKKRCPSSPQPSRPEGAAASHRTADRHRE
jgi:hypothetical protein